MAKTWKNIYRVARSVLFSAIAFVVAVFLLLYILLSIPPVQNKIRVEAEKQASAFLGSDVKVGNVTIRPFNEVIIHHLEVMTPQGERCVAAETVGAGINLWRLLTEKKIELTYAELIGLDARIAQPTADSPLNIDFIIKAFAPKDKNKPPTKFNLRLRNVVLRRCVVSFDRQWIPRSDTPGKTDFNHLRVNDLRADITIPEISNDRYNVDLRRLSFSLSGGLDVEKLALQADVTQKSLSLKNLIIQLPSSEIRFNDIHLAYNGFGDISRALKETTHHIILIDNEVTPSDFGWLEPKLRNFTDPLSLTLDVAGNASEAKVSRLAVRENNNLDFELTADVRVLSNPKNAEISLSSLKLDARHQTINKVLALLPSLKDNIREIVSNCGDISLSATGSGSLSDGNYDADLHCSTSCGDLFVSANARSLRNRHGRLKADVSTEGIDVSRLLGKGKIGNVKADLLFDGTLKGKDIDGSLKVYVPEFYYGGAEYGGLAVEAEKEGRDIAATLSVDNEMALANGNVTLFADGEQSRLSLRADIQRFEPSALGVLPAYRGYELSANVSADLLGNNIDNLLGEARIENLDFFSPGAKSISLDHLLLSSEKEGDGRHMAIRSDWIDGDIDGDFRVADVVREIRCMLADAMPSVVSRPAKEAESHSDVEFSLLVKTDNTLTEFFNLPVRILVDIPVEGSVDGSNRTASLSVDVPYLQQGRNKLLRDSRLNLFIDGNTSSIDLGVASTFPAKNGDMSLEVDITGQKDNIQTDVSWINPDNSSFKGRLSLDAALNRNELSATPDVNVDIAPSIFDIGDARWSIDHGTISYSGKELAVDGVRIWHGSQFVEIGGVASANPSDSISVRLADIDLDYVFGILKINYVNFGGHATGDVNARKVFSKSPVAYTDNLFVKNLAYNGAVLGDGHLKSHWDNDAKEVTIFADIRDTNDSGHRTALLDGGIWVTRDSLSFDVDADRVPIEFLKPFMSAFTSEVSGKASGKAKLYGTFSDIDLTGRLFADTIAMKLDYTNTVYHGSDSVIMNPGHIVIPSFRLYDRNGNSAILTGDLTHRYFHDPVFTFRVSDARNLLCYDTNQKMNPDWYGTLYGNGSAVVRGWPGTVDISVDMALVGESAFTFVLNDTQAAEDYHFLTFSDRRRELRELAERDHIDDIVDSFRKKVAQSAEIPSKFGLDIRASVNPSTLLTLVMDPIAGDKITARGNGAVQVDYESDNEEMQMFGKFMVEEGNYNFSLQDLILRDFKIKEGSSISFNGDPLNANLDITASYRVNTNLSDLDKSFSTDRDLARTNVPVDALLMVNGEMKHPDITFDIELPTLTQDVERKVKSIISTDDMMSRQIIYLLALNRFYTPDYMGTSSNGGELAAVASTTISSQLSNMLGQLTDKFSVSPTFRSDKGDFSDLEVDVALSSRLLNNRLLINGNFGYRDRTTSQTTFVGDFDIEYLLSRNGNLRLKAYNHFNDQNYYLREALTTQGLGVVYRRDFDNPFTFLKRRKKVGLPVSGDGGKGVDTESAATEEHEDSIAK